MLLAARRRVINDVISVGMSQARTMHLSELGYYNEMTLGRFISQSVNVSVKKEA